MPTKIMSPSNVGGPWPYVYYWCGIIYMPRPMMMRNSTSIGMWQKMTCCHKISLSHGKNIILKLCLVHLLMFTCSLFMLTCTCHSIVALFITIVNSKASLSWGIKSLILGVHHHSIKHKSLTSKDYGFKWWVSLDFFDTKAKI